MPIKACIFDLDGVIVNTAKYHYLAWKRLADELGFNFTEEQNERLKGVDRMQSLDILLEIGKITLTEEQKLDAANLKNDWYMQMVERITVDEILPGAYEFLLDVKTQHIAVALGSASKNATTILRRVELAQLFDSIIDGNKTEKAKPNPEVFLMAAQMMGFHPNECVVFDDAYSGIEAALAGGMLAVGIGDPKILTNANVVIPGFDAIEWNDVLNMLMNGK
jgi:beta-phosphoglucomutase